ncbi:transcription termination factor Rho [Corynebacterium aquilae]|uniref:Transcription termination factor Rho n=1 Tax=Corynebacterium aquilae DSM 44791 TaxID=1431546 RepID=A0A1L7CF98_9CORY|nr:transcription termination factor Rho [Corynebacterium aquilae]APT84550.1 transcription termination factor Rho [Corynebacterium aquilae DSM 44791]
MTEHDTQSGAGKDLASLRLPELKKMAQEMGIRGISGKRKSDLIAMIQSGGAAAATEAAAPARRRRRAENTEDTQATVAENTQDQPAEEQAQQPKPRTRTRRRAQNEANDDAPAQESPKSSEDSDDDRDRDRDRGRRNNRRRNDDRDNEQRHQTEDSSGKEDSEETDENGQPVRYESRSAARRARRNRARQNQKDRRRGRDRDDRDQERDDHSDRDNRDRDRDNRDNRDRDRRGDRNDRDDDRRRGRNRRDRGRGRDRDNRDRDNRDRDNRQDDHDDSNLQYVGGILDIVDNNVAFLRTTGYNSSPADVFVNPQMIRRFGLRRGDAITGAIKPGRETTHGSGRNRAKYNPLARVDTVNGMSVEEARQRPDFAKLTPLYPNKRLRLETDPKVLTTRVIDLIMPIGKGQRALIVSPPKAGKTTILQNIANAIATNNPECYLMVVLVDERPEEVTDMQRSVKGEVIASTFDRPPSEHTTVAELAIERAKRLVEQGQDVVVLLDSITRLGRAYNNSSPASGRILSGGVDSNALYPPKRFLGAARNIENGGSLTIIATAMVETGSAGDTVIFEEFKGTGNAELKLDRKISERRVFPAVDVNPSGTRKDELLLGPEEARVMHKLRRILSALDNQQAIDLLIKQLKKTKNNGEFLMQVMSSEHMAIDDGEEDYS